MIYYVIYLFVILFISVTVLYLIKKTETFSNDKLDSCVDIIKNSKAYNNLSLEQKNKYKNIIELLKINTRRYSGNTTMSNPLQMTQECIIPRTYNCSNLQLKKNQSNDNNYWSYQNYCVIDSSILDGTNPRITLGDILESLYNKQTLGQMTNFSEILSQNNAILQNNINGLQSQYTSKIKQMVDIIKEKEEISKNIRSKELEYLESQTFTDSNFNTPIVDSNFGDARRLSLLEVNCNNDKEKGLINSVQLLSESKDNRSTNIRYKASCKNAKILKNSITDHSGENYISITPVYKPGVGQVTIGQQIYLDRQPIQCPRDYGLSSFLLKEKPLNGQAIDINNPNNQNTQIQYEYTCTKAPLDMDSCTDHSARTRIDKFEDVDALSNLDITCPDNKVVNYMRLMTDWGASPIEIRYDYKCCPLKQPMMQSLI